MGKIEYPKRQKTITKSFKKKNTVNNNSQIEKILLQVDELQTAKNEQTKQTDDLQQTKQNTLTAGANISIANGIISATDTTYTAGTNILIDQNNQISAVVDTSTLQPKLTAGSNITIDQNNQISANFDTTSLQTQISNNYNAISNLNAIKQNVLTFDFTPTQNSNHVVTSGGVYDAIQNVAGGGLSEVTASDVDSETATSGQVLTADGEGGASWQTPASGGGSGMTQEQQTMLTQAYNYYLSHVVEPDPHYNPKTFSDYPAGTILQTYDKMEQIYNFELYSSQDYPTIYFCAEPNSIGNINIAFNYKLNNLSGRMYISGALNGSVVFNDIIELSDINQEKTYSKNLYDLFLNTQAKGNNFILSVSLENITGFNVTLGKIKFEINAPNADILSKIVPFDVTSIKNTYYLTDCTDGIAKTASIDSNNIYNMSNIEWQNTNIQSIYMQTCFDVIFYNSNYIMDLDNIGYFYLSDKNRYYIQKTDGTYKIFSDRYYKKWFPSAESNYCFMGLYSDGKLTKSIVKCTNGSTSFYHGRLFSAIKVICCNALYNYFDKNTICEAFLSINENGTVTFHNNYKTSNTVLNQAIGYASNATMYIKDYNSNDDFKFDCYLKVYDKIIKKEYQYQNNQLSLLSMLEIGSYDMYFAMPNNDYFVFKNGELYYYKNNK